MKPVRLCEECHGELRGDAPEGLCPKCLLRLGAAELGIVVRHQGGHSAGHGPEFEPRRFGQYELLERAGQGGMGTVYRARQLNLDRLVALKLLPFGASSGHGLVQRFRAEASAVAALQHPNIVAVHDVGEYEGQPFFSMEYVEGRTLAELVRDQPLPAKRAATYLQVIAEAVHYAHQQGIIHRDLKPSNVLIDAFDQPRITDFGLAKRLHGDADLTHTGQVLGSPNFISPEQAEGRSQGVGPASDVYSLGALLYHLLTRQPPFQADTLTTLLKQVLEAEPVPPHSLNPSIPRDLETICLKCLQKEPARRYPTAQALADDLSRFLREEPILARPVSVAGKAWKWCRRRPLLAGLSAALVLTLLTGANVSWWQLRRAQAGESAARQNAYAADMNLTQAALDSGDVGAAVSLLNRNRPAPGQRDLRGWEWRYFWQRCRGDQLSVLTKSDTAVEHVAFSPNGRWLALRDEQANLTLWDTGSWQRKASYTTADYPKPVAFSSQGNLLGYSIAQAQTVSIVNLDTLREVASLTRPTNTARLAFSADGARLFMLSLDGVLTEWEIASHRCSSSKQVRGLRFTDDRYPAVFSPDGSRLAFAVGGGVGLYELNLGRQVEVRITGAESPPTALSFSADRRLLAAGVGDVDSEVCVWPVEEFWGCGGVAPPPRWRFDGHRDWISGLAFCPDGRALVSAGADSTLRVWSLDQPKVGRSYQGHQHQVLSVAWSPNGQIVASSSKDGSVRLWDPWHEQVSFRPAVLPTSVFSYRFALSAEAKTAILIEPTNRAAVLWNIQKMQPIETLDFAGTNVLGFAWSPDDRTLVTSDESGTLRVWDLAGRRAIASLQMTDALLPHLFFTDNGRFLCCGGVLRSGGRVARMLSVEGWREIPLPSEAMNQITWAAASPDGRLLLVLKYGGKLEIWDVASGRCRRRFSQPLAGAWEEGLVSFSPDGRTWVSSTQKGVLALWDTAGHGSPALLPRTTQELWGVAFMETGSRLLVTGRRSRDVVRVMDTSSRRFVATLSGKPDTYWIARVSADGSTVYAAGEKNVLLWRAPSWAEIKAAEKGEKTL